MLNNILLSYSTFFFISLERMLSAACLKVQDISLSLNSPWH